MRRHPSFLSILFFRMMAEYDLIDTKLALVLAVVTFASPYAFVPPEIEEAGAIDGGGGTLATFFHLYLPAHPPAADRDRNLTRSSMSGTSISMRSCC